MNAPKRIQMSRQRPWRAENPDAVIVARPSRHGNPYAVGALIRDYAAEAACRTLPPVLAPALVTRSPDDFPGGKWPDSWVIRTVVDRADAVACFRALAAEFAWNDEDAYEAWIGELTGRDQACWCPLDQPCHADVLLELANGVES